MLVNKDPISNAFTVSNIIVKYFHDQNKEIDMLKTLKLIYICFGAISAFKRQYLFSERIEAWRLGPVVPDVYYQLQNIVQEEGKLTTEASYKLGNNYDKDKENHNKYKKIVQDICDIYNNMSITNLVNLTHIQGSPWYESYTGAPNVEISKELIIDYYAKLFKID